MPENNHINWTKYAAMLTVCAFLLGAIFWAFGVWVTASESKALAIENRQAIRDTLQQKADKADMQELKQEIRDLNEQIKQLRNDLDSSVFVKHTKQRRSEEDQQ